MSDDPVGDAYRTLRTSILGLDLMPGQQISERPLSEELGVSRTPVRAALTRLAEEGLVERYQRSWRVTPINLADIEDAMQFRRVVELGALELTLALASPSALETLVAQVNESFETPHDVIHDCDVFHKQLVALSGNDYLRHALDMALTRLARPRWLAAQDDGVRILVRDEHLGVVDRLIHSDLEGARASLGSHITDLQQRLAATMTEERQRLRVFSIHTD